jgi:hypothetical protein
MVSKYGFGYVEETSTQGTMDTSKAKKVVASLSLII